MTRARNLVFNPLPQALRAIPVVQELSDAMADARELLADICLRFKAGDAAEEQLARLGQRLAVLVSQASKEKELAPELREEIATLLARVGETVAAGTEWMEAVGPELATQHNRERLRRTYGAP